ncbi:MAG: hypothetical protein HRT47_01485 [Candidatus Caenarcaniphilales bacterium]|nr:hypothetical protein [Candidatus Caenarcaniphilales bacterium]
MAKTNLNNQFNRVANATDIFDKSSANTKTVAQSSSGITNLAFPFLNNANGDFGIGYKGEAATLSKKLKLYYDVATDTGTIGNKQFRGGELPGDAVVTGGYWYVTTPFIGAGSSIGISIPVDDVLGILASQAVATNGSAGGHNIIQDGNGGNVSNITTGKRIPTLDITGGNLTAGAGILVLEYDVLKIDTSK